MFWTIRGEMGRDTVVKAREGIRFYLPLKGLRASEATVEFVYFYFILVIMLIECAVWKEPSVFLAQPGNQTI